jgi:D-xylose transport system substrate-binding protein
MAKRGMRALAVAATLALSMGAVACGDDDDGGGGSGGGGSASSGGGGGGKIALLLPETKTTRYEEQDKPNFEKRVKELCPDCEIIYSNADQDPAKQQQQAEAAITQGAKVIVMSAVDVKSAASIVQSAKQQNVKVIAYGRLIPDADIDYYVSIDPFEVGKQQAEVQMDTLDEKGVKNPKIVQINGAPTDSNSKPYKDGATEVYKARGAELVKVYDTPDWSPDKAQQQMDQSITSLGKDGFDAVYAANDGMAGGAIAALKGASLTPADFSVTGQDAEVAGIQRILAGEQLMTVYQPLIKLASSAADLAVPIAQGKEPDAALAPAKTDNGMKEVPSVLEPTIAITTDNIQDTVIKDGFLKAADICTEEYAEACTEAGVE